jgi:class 3 adenylate cyclase
VDEGRGARKNLLLIRDASTNKPNLSGGLMQSTQTKLDQLLQKRLDCPEQSQEIDQQIQALFSQDCAILVLDLSGFSRLTIRYGIIHFMAMIYRMNAIASPLVQQHQGRVIKQEADNLFAGIGIGYGATLGDF